MSLSLDPPTRRRPEDAVQVLDARPCFEILEERFGIPPATFERYVVFKPDRECLWLVDRDLELPVRPEPHTLGIPFFYADLDYPRPTTAATVHFGHLARRHVVDVEPADIARLLYRELVHLDAERASSLESNGYVMLRFRGLVFGLGYFRPEGEGGTVRGILPRSWTTRLGVEPPPEEPPPWVRGDEGEGDGRDGEQSSAGEDA